MNVRKSGKLNWLKPDGKAQVSVEYNNGILINNNETNIFVLLYMLSNQYLDKIKDFPIIDREGKKYYYQLNSIVDNTYSIDLKQSSIAIFIFSVYL